MADDTEKKDETPGEETESASPAPPPEGALSVPFSVPLPIEALLQLPPPTPPNQPIDPAQLPELTADGDEEPISPSPIDGSVLREALQNTPNALAKLKGLSPRLLAKDTVGRGIDAALEAGGLRTPTRPSESQ